jgi:hypothetical protein
LTLELDAVALERAAEVLEGSRAAIDAGEWTAAARLALDAYFRELFSTRSGMARHLYAAHSRIGRCN